jgi:hypothetical protein
MSYAQLSRISSHVEDIVSADAIAVGFVKSESDGYELVGAIDAITAIENFFDVDLIDEITFFQPAGKAGEILEIPVSQKATKADRWLPLVWVENYVVKKLTFLIYWQLTYKIFALMQLRRFWVRIHGHLRVMPRMISQHLMLCQRVKKLLMKHQLLLVQSVALAT